MESVLHESTQQQTNSGQNAKGQVEKKVHPEPKRHPTLTTMTWSSIAEGLGDVFGGNLIKDPIDITFSNISYTASLGFRKGI